MALRSGDGWAQDYSVVRASSCSVLTATAPLLLLSVQVQFVVDKRGVRHKRLGVRNGTAVVPLKSKSNLRVQEKLEHSLDRKERHFLKVGIP